MRAKLTVAAAALLLFAGATHAHHSTTPVYDSKRTVTKTGVVTSFRLVNPHAMLKLDVADESGTVVPWTVEFDGRVNLTRFGWDDDTLKPGDRITVTGNPTHSDSPRMFFIELERPDGTQLRRAMIDPTQAAIEEARRKRAEQKQQ
jgi:hypothetical protein